MLLVMCCMCTPAFIVTIMVIEASYRLFMNNYIARGYLLLFIYKLVMFMERSDLLWLVSYVS